MAALRNLRSLANRYTAPSVSPNFLGTWLASQGYTQEGDAEITASIAGTVLTVSEVVSGSLAAGSLLTDATFTLLPATTVQAQLSGPTGGAGTYSVLPSQSVASEPMSANGTGERMSGYTVHAGVAFQVQALTGEDLEQIDDLNQQKTVRAVYFNGQIQGVNRPNVQGGDILQIPTGLTGAAYDTWLVIQVLEGWDVDGWSKVACVLQMPGPEDQ